MNERHFAKRLAQELPHWQKEGWVSAEGGPAILADLAARETAPMWASALALIGAVLLGLGVITWFAAHWNEIGKLAKLLLVALALTASHLGHGFCLSRGALPKLAQGMALLSVLFFGAAIMLIGQIYNIDAHFPDGIALWAAGGLLTALLFASQPALLASLALAALWTWYEQFDYRGMNWPLLGYLALAAWPLLRHGWSLAARAWGILLILWLLGWHAQPWFDTGIHWETHAHVRLFILQILGLAGGWALAQASEHPFARAVRADFLLVALVGAFAFTFPRLAAHGPAGAPAGDPLPWLMAFVGVGAIYAYGIARLVRASELAPERLRIGIALAVAFAALLLIEIAVPRSGSGPALLWNALFLGILYWIGDLGMRRGDRQMVNYAFTGFSVWVLARYFDTFWTLMDRSLFFMAGGILLLAGGGWLEHRRRTLLRDLAGRRPS
ncbi:putative Membrane protein-like protein [Sterolibacterium denitrificans]|uniref:Membrane protein-like protein n=1 Tax=Sterolibacterium denitrificans TaxID=157592 RepID=A0A7Z7HRM1_9PROT|nr:DUF2157 domain-containing protein [Sterolibacterium denitrificans]SMB27570.1 putative Membrane protein-like protein [Sterolibacterium denitrificans]